MAKLIYFMPTSLDGYIADDGNFDWSTQARRHLRSLPISTALSARISMDAGSTKRWRCGRRQRSFPASRRPCWTSRGSGKQPTRSSTPNRGRPTEDASRAGSPPAGGSRVEDSIASRYFGGWSDPRRPRDPDRARGRVSSARRAYSAWRRHSGAAQQRTRKAGPSGRAPFC